MESKKRKALEVTLPDLFAYLALPENLARVAEATFKHTRKGCLIKSIIEDCRESLPGDLRDVVTPQPTAFLFILEVISKATVTKDEMIQIIESLHKIMPVLFENQFTLNSRYVELRRTIFKKFPEGDVVKKAWSLLCLPAEDRKALKTNYQLQVYDRNCAQTDVSAKHVLEVVEALFSIPRDWVDEMILVALSTGARSIEILKVSEFFEDPEDKGWIKIKGVAKSKGETRVIKKPLIGECVTGKDICASVDTLRLQVQADKHWDLSKMTNTEINNGVSATLQKRTRKIFGQKFTFHKLRALYAALAWFKVSELTKLTMTANAFYSAVLGHKPTSLGTSLSYQRFTVTK